jgi:hypothetical protein
MKKRVLARRRLHMHTGSDGSRRSHVVVFVVHLLDRSCQGSSDTSIRSPSGCGPLWKTAECELHAADKIADLNVLLALHNTPLHGDAERAKLLPS